jgi:hypothetical protein
MKKYAFTFFLIGLFFGIFVGNLIRHWPTTKTEVFAASDEKEKVLGKLYPEGIRFRVLQDMRILTLLNSNDFTMSKRLLVQDLDINISSLSMLSNEVKLEESVKKTLQEGELFLEAAKK